MKFIENQSTWLDYMNSYTLLTVPQDFLLANSGVRCLTKNSELLKWHIAQLVETKKFFAKRIGIKTT